MSKPFRLMLSKIVCNAEQYGEPGKDEIYLFGVGVTNKGDRLLIEPRKLGSFGNDQSTPSGYSHTVIDTHVSDHVSLVSTCLWLFERDSGGLANSGNEIRQEFDRLMDLQLAALLPFGLGDAQYPYALARTALGMRREIARLADGWNNDEISDPVIIDHGINDPALPGVQKYSRNFIGAGVYTLEFHHSLELVSPILL
jgi:hypothetical protein